MLFTSIEKSQFNLFVVSRLKKNIDLISRETEQLSANISLRSAVSLEKAESKFQQQKQDFLIIFADPLSETKLIEFIKNIKKKNNKEQLPLLTILSEIDSSKKTRLINAGINTILTKPVSRKEFRAVIEDKLKYLFAFKELEHVEKVIYSFVEALEANDPYTSGHSKRVARLSYKIGELLNFKKPQLNKLYMGALTHDIGKVGVSDEIINKAGKLNDEEYENIKRHPVIGIEIFKHLSLVEGIKDIILHHHERWDGGGYPDGLKEKDIPLASRIVASADAIDAMLSTRSYRKGMDIDKVKLIFNKNKGAQWSPKLVDLILTENIIELGAKLNKKIESSNSADIDSYKYFL